ncbi:hypothetical protein KOR34_41530 [Posidoniimonas corsicana]|uniref:Uncharacterized protein n=1 Tax=Posidoniimonas corsicana TaxID=1938618 RepID=A0A5C5V317_9BACT|nr:hypothetical protein KOR34_41530 [Posidoniimonas corsicana]
MPRFTLTAMFGVLTLVGLGFGGLAYAVGPMILRAIIYASLMAIGACAVGGLVAWLIGLPASLRQRYKQRSADARSASTHGPRD